MKKNIVFIPAVKDTNRIGRSIGYEYSIKSWKHFCDKNDVELFLLEDGLYDSTFMSFAWQRYHLFKLLEEKLLSLGKLEASIAKELTDKYGKGSLDIETGAFTPVE